MILLALGLHACSVDLYSGLSEREANQIVAALARQGIPAERKPANDGMVTVTIPKGRFAEAMAVLDENGLPKQTFETLGDVFTNKGLISSPVEERARMIYGLSQGLSSTISDIDGVLSARVHLVLPDNDPLRQAAVPSSASVFIRHQESMTMTDLIPQIKMLVANGVSGLSYDNVSVVLVPVPRAAQLDNDSRGYVSFLGLWLHPDSLAFATWLVYGLVAAVLLLGGVILLMARRRSGGEYLISTAVVPSKETTLSNG